MENNVLGIKTEMDEPLEEYWIVDACFHGVAVAHSLANARRIQLKKGIRAETRIYNLQTGEIIE